ncbi:MAG: T9SS type A sorting domain-containing protein [Bacteroidetes bacterium]|nr:T9SS type A sorting domain-containing protein [Bacteroidota bacterium]
MPFTYTVSAVKQFMQEDRKTKLTFPGYTQGIYFVKVNSDGKQHVRKIVVTK